VLTINYPDGNLVDKQFFLLNIFCESRTRYKIYPNQLNRLKGVEKLHCRKLQPILCKSSKTEWREPFDFPTGISGFQLLMVSTPSVHLMLTLFSIILILLTPIKIKEEYPINAAKFPHNLVTN